MKLQKSQFIQNYLTKCKIKFEIEESYIEVTGNIPITSVDVLNKFAYKKDKPQPKKKVISEEAIALKKYVQEKMKDVPKDERRIIIRPVEKDEPKEPEKPKEYQRPKGKYSNPNWDELYSNY